MNNEKEFDINDLLHTAKELEKWQKKDKFEINMNVTTRVSDDDRARRDNEDYARYRRGEM